MQKQHVFFTQRHASICIYAFVAALVAAYCWTPGVQAQPGPKTSPIEIEADRMETSQGNSMVSFTGNVQANQGNLTIHADAMTVLYARTGPKPDASLGPQEDLTRDIERIKANGNIKIIQDDRVATGDTMDFDATKRIIILAGNAKAWQNQNMVSGEKIILYLDEGKSVVEKSTTEGERVKAFIYPAPEGKTDGDNPKP